MADSLEKKIEEALLAGKSKQDIFENFGKNGDQDEIISITNDLSYPERRQKVLAANILLIMLIIYITGKQLIGAFHDASVSMLLVILSMIVPTINLYLLRKIFRFQKMGYQFMGILGALALVRPENRLFPDFFAYLIIIVISWLLFFFLFPKAEQLQNNDSLNH